MWWGGAVPKRETKFPKEQIAEVWLVLLSFLPGEMKEIDTGESFCMPNGIKHSGSDKNVLSQETDRSYSRS